MYRKYFKRPFDVFCALSAIAVFWWLYIIVAVLVRIKLGSPVIFKQERPGLNEKIFTLYKFRTMTDAKDENGNLLPDNIRLTEFGKLLRSTSLDELPEVWNILKGDMSVIGPRPLLVRDMVFMTPEQRMRHSVRPGLSGLAQVRGRNIISWESKLEADLQYIQLITFCKDIRIILKTVKKMVHREGISAEGMETAEDFGDYLLRVGMIDESTYTNEQCTAKRLLLIGKK